MEGDLGQKLEALLNSPDGMARIAQAMEAFGVTAAVPAPVAPEPPAPTPSAVPPDTGASGTGPDLSGLLKLMPLLSSFGQEDQHTALLKALRPYLHGEREKRLDDSVKLMQLLKLLPILQERGLF